MLALSQEHTEQANFAAQLCQALYYQLDPVLAKDTRSFNLEELEQSVGLDLSALSTDNIILSSSINPEPDQALLLVELFELQHVGWQKQKKGVFYTPFAVATQIVESALATIDSKRELPSVLDPACGSGVFLLALIRTLRPKLSDDELLDWCANKLCAVDLDKSALQAAVAIIKLELLRTLNIKDKLDQVRKLKLHFFCADTLLADIEPSLVQDSSRFCFSNAFADIFVKHGFDLIIGNPPYAQSRSGLIDSLENERLKSQYQGARSGKVNKYLLFMSRCYDLLANVGVLSLIVPNAWLGIDAGRPIRKRFLEHGALHSITRLKGRVFKAAEVESVIFIAQKSVRNETITIYEKSTEEKTARKLFRLNSAEITLSADCIIPLVRDNQLEQVFACMRSNSFLLESATSPFTSMIALQAYAVGKGQPAQSAEVVKQHLFHAQSKLSAEYQPYLNGKEIDRYQMKWSGSYLRYGPWLAEPQKLERFSGTRIALREILAPAPYCLRACVLEETFLYNKSVLHIILKNHKSDPDLIWALCAIINSQLLSQWISYNGKKSQRAMFPKLLNADLRALPLPNCLLNDYSSLAKLARKRAKFRDDQLDQEIDKLVSRSYGIDWNTISSKVA